MYVYVHIKVRDQLAEVSSFPLPWQSWVLGIELRSSGFLASTFSCWVNLPAQVIHFLKQNAKALMGEKWFFKNKQLYKHEKKTKNLPTLQAFLHTKQKLIWDGTQCKTKQKL